MQGPGISDLEVATIADLSDLHVAPLTDGSTVYVISEDAQYRLYKNSGLVADGIDIVRPEVGSPIAGADNARWIRTTPATVISAAVQITGAIGTETVMDGTTRPRVLIPENTSETYTISLMVRRNADGVTVYYQRQVTVSRDGAGAPTLTSSADYVSNEDPAWPVGNASFPATTTALVSGQYYLVVQFAQANAATTPSTAKATVVRSSPIFS